MPRRPQKRPVKPREGVKKRIPHGQRTPPDPESNRARKERQRRLYHEQFGRKRRKK